MQKSKKINSRRKGHTFEREVCTLLNDAFKPLILTEEDKFKRVPLSGGFDKKHFPGDILTLNNEISARMPYSLECKSYYDWNIDELLTPSSNMNKWITQSCIDAFQSVTNKIPVVVFKRNRGTIFAMTFSHYFTNIIKEQQCIYISTYYNPTLSEVIKCLESSTKLTSDVKKSIVDKYRDNVVRSNNSLTIIRFTDLVHSMHLSIVNNNTK